MAKPGLRFLDMDDKMREEEMGEWLTARCATMRYPKSPTLPVNVN